MKVGLVGWRGMVGSVLMQRMVEENDFAHIDPVYSSTSNAGGKAPDFGGKSAPALQDANSIDALKAMDVILTCQGGDYTNEIYPQLRAAVAFSGHLPALKDGLTAEENLASLVALEGSPASRDAIAEALDEVALSRQSALPARVLSQGQRRRIGAAFRDQQRDVQLPGGLPPISQYLISATTPGVK